MNPSLEQIKSLLSAATERPWPEITKGPYAVWRCESPDRVIFDAYSFGKGDPELIVALVNAAPSLIALAEAGIALREQVQKWHERDKENLSYKNALAAYDSSCAVKE